MSDPDVQAFRMRFPEFETTEDVIIGFALEEAQLFVNGWNKAARVPALLYMAAHICAKGLIAADNEGRAVRSETIGRLSTTYADQGANGIVGEVETTSYGTRYLSLRYLGNKAAFRVI